MKTKIKKIMAAVIFCSLLLYSIVRVENIVKEKNSSARDLSYKTFFDSAEEYDVIFLGTSHVMYGVNPLEIWNEYGIASYNWGSPTCTIPAIYWKLMNILDYRKPQLVVVDCFRATWVEKTYDTYRMHEAFDAFPLSYTKYQAVNDLMRNEIRKRDGLVYSDKDIYGVLFPLYAYHSRWDQLTQIDFTNNYIDTKGCEFEINVADPADISNTTAKAEISDEMQGVIYLKKIIEECKKRDISILLTYLPFPTAETWKMEANMIQDIADEYNINYLNFTDLNVVNYKTDFADSDSHMNITGETKVSHYFGKYISENYDIPDKRDDERYQSWFADYQLYTDYKFKTILNQTSIETELMLLAAANSFSACVYIKDASKIFENERVPNLLMNIMGTDEAANIEIAKANRTSYFMLHDSINQCTKECLNEDLIQETSFGTVAYSHNNGQTGLYIGNMEKNLLDVERDHEQYPAIEPGIWIYVIDNRTGKVACEIILSAEGVQLENKRL